MLNAGGGLLYPNKWCCYITVDSETTALQNDITVHFQTNAL